MKRLTKQLENRIVTRLYSFMGIGVFIASGVSWLMTSVPAYRDFLYLYDANNRMILSDGGWILLFLPLVMFLSAPRELRKMSFPGVMLLMALFCALIGAALSGFFVVYVKADIFRCLLIAAVMFVAMSGTGKVFRHDMLSWQCVVLTIAWGGVLMFASHLIWPMSTVDIGACAAVIIGICAVVAYSVNDIIRIMTAVPSGEFNHIAACCTMRIFFNLVGVVVVALRFWRGVEPGDNR
uniref:Uncharacterized protein n=1 Tax=uncultured Alphaproteobacteria bacterium TaxID=91750 RepID=A0A6G8F2U2_9PROT|nr:hypothetical protein PlAlph_5120 [uncultured Alphaproteobacteria bacterium]